MLEAVYLLLEEKSVLFSKNWIFLQTAAAGSIAMVWLVSLGMERCAEG